MSKLVPHVAWLVAPLYSCWVLKLSPDEGRRPEVEMLINFGVVKITELEFTCQPDESFHRDVEMTQCRAANTASVWVLQLLTATRRCSMLTRNHKVIWKEAEWYMANAAFSLYVKLYHTIPPLKKLCRQTFASYHGGSGPPSNRWFLGPTRPQKASKIHGH